jgi:serine/threonine-protein kinase
MTEFRDRLRAALAPIYDLGEELPGGGMSRVFVATERALGRRVVVKVLPPELAAGVNRDRFQREIQLAASLQHPHIVPLLAAGEDAELLYYTMPFIDGESLRDCVARKGRLSVREVVRMLHDVVDALAYAHGRGVVHRDIKPGNILTQGSHALVTDFGVAKAISAALPGTGMTTTGMAIGTPAYMAPEQLAADPAADHRIDLYAVGLLAYELLAGKSPFASASPTETMAAQFTRDPAPLETIRDDVPPALASLIRRLLSKRADDRPADAHQVLAALEALPVPSGPATPTASIRAGRPGRRMKQAVWVAIGLIALAVAGIGGAIAASRHISSGLFGAGRDTLASPVPLRAATDTFVLGDSAPAVVLSSPAAAPAGDGESRLTRADSIAIAEAVRAELARAGRPQAAPAPEPGAAAEARIEAQADQYAARLQHTFVDSLLRSSMAEVSRTVPRVFTVHPSPPVPVTPPPGVTPEQWTKVREAESLSILTTEMVRVRVGAARPRRVLIAAAREDDRALATLSAAVVRSFRGMLHEREGFDPVSPVAARAAVAAAGNLEAAAAQIGAELVTTVDFIGVPGDSVVMLIKLRDLTAATPFSYRVAASGTVAREQFGDAAERTLRSAIEQLGEMSEAPRR